MDANDVELMNVRSRRDTDEVYPLDELSDESEFDVYKPAARKQNRYFSFGVIALVVAIGVLFGAKAYILPGEDVELQSNADKEQGTVTNNEENAKSQALRDHTNDHYKKPHSSGYQNESAAPEQPQGEEGNDKDENAETEDEEGPSNNDSKDSEETETTTSVGLEEKLKQWHDVKVATKDGQMYEVLEVLSHDPSSFLEGLTFYNDKLYESVGLNKQSAVLLLDPNTGETLERHVMDPEYFAEGLTFAHGKLYQLTYHANKGFIYDADDLSAKPEEFSYTTTTGEGWGFTYDEKKDEFIVSDGSEYLLFWDRKTLEFKRKHQIIRLNGTPAKRINELEFWRDRVVANVWYQHVLLVINPVTGLVEKEYDFTGIWDAAGVKKNKGAEVFNGISVSSDPDVLYVTGKWWANMFKIKLLPELST